MKILSNILTCIIGVVMIGWLTGCSTISNLTPAQIQAVGAVITQVADQGAVYAIQQDQHNASYFELANAAIDTFVLGTDLSPASLQAALAKVPGVQNQWVNVAVSAVVAAYELSYQQYVTGTVNGNAIAKAWVTAVENGFKQALAQTGNNAFSVTTKETIAVPYFVTADGKVDRVVIEGKIKAAGVKK